MSRVAVGAPALVRGDGFSEELSGRVAEVVGEAGANALYPSDPDSFADRRVVKVRIRRDEAARLRELSNTQVNVKIGR